MTGFIQNPVANYTVPSLGLPPQQAQTGRGTCTLAFEGNTLQFRTNPNTILWDYSLITHIEQTYGGRVVQILGVKMDNLVVTVDCGQGGWAYAMYVVQFMRDLMVTQRDGKPATFTYTTRNWKLNVFALNVPFHDAVDETIRELKLEFKVQEDVSGVQTAASLASALQALQDGIGFVVNDLNAIDGQSFYSGSGAAPNNAYGGGAGTALQSTTNAFGAVAQTGAPSTGVPGVSGFTSLLSGLIPGL